MATIPIILNPSANYSIIFPKCKFGFGIAYSGNSFNYTIVDHITVWLGWPTFNQYWEGLAVQVAKANGKTPVLYAYFIAFMSRQMWGLQDCNVGTPSLCQQGSEFIRQYRSLIISNYKNQSAQIASLIGSTTEVVWLIEPDFW